MASAKTIAPAPFVDTRTIGLVREKKRIVGSGTWSTAKMSKTAFPLSKSGSQILGAGWNWAVYSLEGAARRYKLLVGYHPGKEQYRGWLGLEVANDLAVLARLEYHPDFHGWHCHLKQGFLSTVAVGVVKQPSHRDRSRRCRVKNVFGVGELNALQIACRIFNVVPTYRVGELLQ